MSDDIEDLENEDWVESVDVDEEKGQTVVAMADTDGDPVNLDDLYTANERLRELVEQWRDEKAFDDPYDDPNGPNHTHAVRNCADGLEELLDDDGRK